MPNSWFRFQQFQINHGACAMKVGTDGVLLGAWAGDIRHYKRMLDVGAGTGLIALMLRQRYDSQVDAIEIEGACFDQCVENFRESPWADDLHPIHDNFSNWSAAHKYDLIVSNPPFFTRATNAPQATRNLARHQEAGLAHAELIAKAATLLNEGGQLAMVMPIAQSDAAMGAAIKAGLHLQRACKVRGHASKNWKRYLLQWQKTPLIACQFETLTLEKARGERTRAYRELTSKFYLNP
jgi:tRNA1Val (adenine37-N6)-methyltransferase